MESPLAGNSSSVREKVMEEIVRGCGHAAQLQIVLRELTGTDDGSATSEDLVTKTLRSFTEALSLLSCSESGLVLASPPYVNQRRKRSKRRNVQETWMRITAMPTEDGYAWRKYGQKGILNAKHLRCYYRCAYRLDKGCPATKQVQRTEDDPPKFLTKYIGHHTCKDDVNTSFLMDYTSEEEGLLLNFESTTPTKQYLPLLPSFPSSKEEDNKSIPSMKPQHNPSSSEYLPPQDLTKFQSSTPIPSTSQSGLADGVSGCTSSSSRSFDMDMELMDSVYLNDVFLLGHGQLF